MSQGACSQLGLKDGQRMKKGDLPFKGFPPPPSLLPGFGKGQISPELVNEICSLHHEGTHACHGPKDKLCEAEQIAYPESIKCFGKFITLFDCARSPSPLCVGIKNLLVAHNAALEYYKCRCNFSAPAICKRQCREKYGRNPQYRNDWCDNFPEEPTAK